MTELPEPANITGLVYALDEELATSLSLEGERDLQRKWDALSAALQAIVVDYKYLLYTAEQMLEQRRLGRLEGLEEAAKVCDTMEGSYYSGDGATAAGSCADQIRRLKEKAPDPKAEG